MVISWHRIEAVIVRHCYHLSQDWIRIVQTFYWPLLDILMWGYVGIWVSGDQNSMALPYAMVIGGSLWNLVVRGCYEISVSFLEEIWSCNLINLFSSPLLLSEWVIASVIMVLGMTIALAIFLVGVIYLAFGLNVLMFGWPLLVVSFQLLLAGLWTGFLGAVLVAIYGRRVDALVYMNGWILLPFSCVYYTVDVLPGWAQLVAKAIPMTYTFDAMRSVIMHGIAPRYEISMAFALNIVYIVISLYLFKYFFEKSRVKGLERLIN